MAGVYKRRLDLSNGGGDLEVLDDRLLVLVLELRYILSNEFCAAGEILRLQNLLTISPATKAIP